MSAIFPVSHSFRYEVLLDYGETSNKCTIAPLQGDSDFLIRRFARGRPIGAFQSSVLLHPDGKLLAGLKGLEVAEVRIGAIDCLWRRLPTILNWVEKPLPTLVRIPEGFRTAYPRQSKLDLDPSSGLATIEALFVAAALLGHWDTRILRHYYFGKQFIIQNWNAFLSYETPPFLPDELMYQPRGRRDSEQRRLDRGRMPSMVQ